MTPVKPYYYEKRYIRPDGRVLVRQFSRSFEYGECIDPYSGEYFKLVPDELIQQELNFDPDTLEKENKENNSLQSSMSRARNKIKILSFSNPDLIGMLTLTNKDCPSEKVALKRFKNFREKIKENGYTDFKFLGVKEFQKRGSIHWHLLVNYCPALAPSPNNPKKLISSLWSYGWSDFVYITGDDKWRTELYLLKYMTKNHLKQFAQYYVRSRNLDEIEPQKLKSAQPIPVQADNIWTTQISNSFVDNFTITDYTVNIKYLNQRRIACKNVQSTPGQVSTKTAKIGTDIP